MLSKRYVGIVARHKVLFEEMLLSKRVFCSLGESFVDVVPDRELDLRSQSAMNRYSKQCLNRDPNYFNTVKV